MSRASASSVDVAIIGGGISGLYCARELGRADRSVTLLEARRRFGGRIETVPMVCPAEWSDASFYNAEFGPMRFELADQPLLRRLCEDLKIATLPFRTPGGYRLPTSYDVLPDERDAEGNPLDSFQLLRLGIFRLFGKRTRLRPLDGEVEVVPEDDKWLPNLDDEALDSLRRTAKLPGTDQCLHDVGLWNALQHVLSQPAIRQIIEHGPFYHFIHENPNAVEWSIFWLRIFKEPAMSFIPSGVRSIVDGLVADLERNANISLHSSQRVVAVALDPLERLVVQRVDVDTQEELDPVHARHVVAAIPQGALLDLDIKLPPRIRREITLVIPSRLLKVWVIVKRPPWWFSFVPKQNERAYLVPSRELHYNEAPNGHIALLIYTDDPARAYWQHFVNAQFHEAAEMNANSDLEEELRRVLFDLHVGWAADELSKPRGAEQQSQSHLTWASPQRWNAKSSQFREFIRAREKIFPKPELERLNDEASGETMSSEWAHAILSDFDGGGEVIRRIVAESIGAFGIHDWSRAPFGGASYAWRPRARSYEILKHLEAFSIQEDGRGEQNVHICGEAYSDYQAFIEGALRSAERIAAVIVEEA